MNDRAEAGDDESDASDEESESGGSTPAERSSGTDSTGRSDDREVDRAPADVNRSPGGDATPDEPARSPSTGGDGADGGDSRAAEVDGPDGEPDTPGDDSAGRADGTDSPANDADQTDQLDADSTGESNSMPGVPEPDRTVPEDVRKYERFKKMDGAQYDRVNEFLRDRTYVTAREWAIARLCADFRTETGVEMTKIGENLPDLVPFMTDTYTPQAVNQSRSSFDEKVRKAGATFLYWAMCDFYTAEELDDVMYEVTEVSKFLLEVEGVDLSVEDELDAEERISSVMREVRRASKQLREEDALGDDEGAEGEANNADDADDPDDDTDEAADPDASTEHPGDTEGGASNGSADESGGVEDARRTEADGALDIGAETDESKSDELGDGPAEARRGDDGAAETSDHAKTADAARADGAERTSSEE